MDSIAISGHKPGPHLLITGGVHGDEFEPMQALRQLAHQISPVQLRGRLTLVPCVNAPAFALGRRTAEDNLDLARTCPGNATGTVTERLAAELAALIRTADYYIDLHTGGTRFSISPLAGYMLHTDPKILDTQRRMAWAFNLPVIWGTTSELEGRSLSVARDVPIPAIYTEHGGGGTCHPLGVADYVQGCLNVLATLDMLTNPLPESRVKHIVEDSRSQSGHLQINYPAPETGYFHPAVALNQFVQPGELLGEVSDHSGKTRHEIRAQTAGMILLLATFPSVQKNDCTCVILETSLGAPGFPTDIFRNTSLNRS